MGLLRSRGLVSEYVASLRLSLGGNLFISLTFLKVNTRYCGLFKLHSFSVYFFETNIEDLLVFVIFASAQNVRK